MLLHSNHFWAFRLFCFQKVLVPKHEIPERLRQMSTVQETNDVLGGCVEWNGLGLVLSLSEGYWADEQVGKQGPSPHSQTTWRGHWLLSSP